MPKKVSPSLFDDIDRPVPLPRGDPRRKPSQPDGAPFPQRLASGYDLDAIIEDYAAGRLTDDHMGRVVNTCVSQLRGWELATIARVVRDLMRSVSA